MSSALSTHDPRVSARLKLTILSTISSFVRAVESGRIMFSGFISGICFYTVDAVAFICDSTQLAEPKVQKSDNLTSLQRIA